MQLGGLCGRQTIRPCFTQTTCKDATRSLLSSHGKIAPKGLWTKKGLAWLKEEEMPTSAAGLKRDLLLDELTEAKHRVRTVTKALNEIGISHQLASRTLAGGTGLGLMPGHV